MKAFVSSCIVVVLISLIVEIFCPAKVMKKPIFMVISLISLVVLVNGFKGFISNNQQLVGDNLEFSISQSESKVFQSVVENTRQNIFSALTQIGAEVESVELEYEIDELTIQYKSCSIKLKNAQDYQKYKELVSNLTGLTVEEISVYE